MASPTDTEISAPAVMHEPKGSSPVGLLLRSIAKRLLQLIALLFVLSTVLFFLLRLSGDPASVLAPEDASQETIALIREQYGLDHTLIVQYLIFLGQVAQFDFGVSLYSGQDALALVLSRLPATLQLAGYAVLTTVVIAIPLGTWLGARSGGNGRNIVTVVISVLQGTPGFVTGLLLIQVFAVWLGVLPSIAGDGWQSTILPTLTLSVFLIPQLARVLSSGTGEVMAQDFVRTAVATGAARTILLVRHALPNALLGATALIGAQFAALLSGALLTEFIFAWPGLGLLLVDAVSTLDFPVVQAAVFMIAVLVFLVNLVMDVLFQIVDPRLRRKTVKA